MRLRTKLLLVMTGVTSTAMLILGVILGVTTNNFLFDQTRHQGVELAKMTAQVGRAVMDGLERQQELVAEFGDGEAEPGLIPSPAELRAQVQRYLNNARRWSDTAPGDYSVVTGILFKGGPLDGVGVGDVPDLDSRMRVVLDRPMDFAIPGRREVRLDHFDEIDAHPTYTEVDQVKIPVYRFKVALDDRIGHGYDDTVVWVDIRYEHIERVRIWLWMSILGGVLLIALLGVVAANYLANRITKPVRILMSDMRQVAKGNLDHRTKPHSTDEIGVLAGEFNHMTHNLKVAQEAVVEQEKAAYELSIARDVQQQLLPSEAPSVSGYDIGAFYKGAKAVSGDYYDFIPLDDDQVGFIVADVSGKGVPGSMVMGVTRTIVRLVAGKHGNQAAETLKETNRLIAEQIKRGMFVTAFYCVLDRRSGEMTFTSAGHNPMVIYRHETKSIELAAPKGIAIGFNAGPLFDKNIQEFHTTLQPGDAFVLYTDGFPEAMNEQHREYGDEQFYQHIAQSGHLGPAGMIRHLVDEVTRHRGRASQSDDLTMIAVRRMPAAG